MNHETMIAYLIAMVTVALFFILFRLVHRPLGRLSSNKPPYLATLPRYCH
jgi:ABC-type branched-subunit amino acid transport system permease subunit